MQGLGRGLFITFPDLAVNRVVDPEHPGSAQPAPTHVYRAPVRANSAAGHASDRRRRPRALRRRLGRGFRQDDLDRLFAAMAAGPDAWRPLPSFFGAYASR